MQKSDRTHFILNGGRLRRQDNNIYFDKFDETGGVRASKILPINAIDEIYILAHVELDTYTLAFLADNNILLHVFSPFQSFRGNFYPSTSNSVNKSGFVLLSQLRAFDDPVKRVYIAREITRAHMLNDAANCKKHGVKFDPAPHIAALDAAADVGQIMAAEGAFQKLYYEKWNEIITDQRSFKFTVRSKRPPADKINSFISYINMRIYNVCLSEIYKTELDPRIGFLHEPNYRALSLHLDLAEIFKPILGDTLIFAMLNKKEITAKDFQTDAGRIKFSNDAIQKIEMKMISRLSETIALNGQNLTWRQVIRREANQLKKCICEDMPYVGFVWR
ncbi:CRISPR-associated endonuclease Cas1 [Campylobacter curvus]|uniref:CRISPR-associated endonuclease Cas1 n=1 Tax=Campylobacter curvus TaxID=200 RepID=UPI000372116F|nr:CRISPR-associated endonuclease Cas1 [Campylobacter curvus]QKF61181.1 CRISPR/Cas system-associated endonuclease Cas1, type I-B [Campylobacter curvus]UEB49500.1 CRISPR-associated endonuclease Cas1 [Campylobacter curvus]